MERSTRQRSAIRAAIDAAQRPLSPQEVLAASQAAVAGLGLATVYRNLKLLVEAGEIQQVTLPGDSARYEPARQAQRDGPADAPAGAGHQHASIPCHACPLSR